MSQELVHVKQELLRPIAKPGDFIEAHKELTTIITSVLVEGQDYGTVKGIDKPFLFKPGAERLAKAFGATPHYDILSSQEDHNYAFKSKKKVWGQRRGEYRFEETDSVGLYSYTIRCSLIDQTGRTHGTGIGCASTMESKYADRPRDCQNTVLKMAQKRALVAAVLNAYALSDRFTQDEDIMPAVPASHGAASVAKEPEPEKPTGFDPDNKAHRDWAKLKLEHLTIPVDFWEVIMIELRGRPSSDLPHVIKEVIK